ncbi:DUF222 domain-containing protein [Rhodococcus sp. BP-252]|uniref:HNH endonuclease signature motif containing protein n=1 Tax=Rhodococcus sp. BP-252 TaxID=2739479 RepID=UPI0035A90D30
MGDESMGAVSVNAVGGGVDWSSEVPSVPEWYVSDAEAEGVSFPDGVGGGDRSGADAGGGSAAGGGVPVIGPAFLASVVASWESAAEVLGGVQTFGMGDADRRALLVRVEVVQRMLFSYGHTWIADLIGGGGLDGMWGSTPEALAVLLGISRDAAGQRVLLAKEFGERTSLTGERLEPLSADTSRAGEDGVIGEEHQQIVRKFFRRLGGKVDVETRERAEAQLAQLARELGPDHFKAAAGRLYDVLDPDGEDESPERVADRCYVRLEEQGPDGLSKVRMVVDAEFRAYLEAVLAKWAKPGQCNSADLSPVVDDPDVPGDPDSTGDLDAPGDSGAADDPDADTETGTGDAEVLDGPNAEHDSTGSGGDDGSTGSDGDGTDSAGTDEGLFEPGVDDSDTPAAGNASTDTAAADRTAADGAATDKTAPDKAAEERAGRDRRGRGRRQHDAVKMVFRQMLASGQMGRHRGLPVTAVVSMSWKDLEAGTGHAVTATGSLVKMRDAIRMASHAHHYLVLFDEQERPLQLRRTKRIASEDQRIVLIAADRGCSFPGCTRPATWSQVHHVKEWAAGGNTDIEDLTFGCDQHHRLVGPGNNDWATTKAGANHPYPGRTLWHAPASIDPSRRGRVNHFHHPNEYIYPCPEVPLPDMPAPDSPASGVPVSEADTRATCQPETVQPETLQSATCQPETVQPETLQSDPVQPELFDDIRDDQATRSDAGTPVGQPATGVSGGRGSAGGPNSVGEEADPPAA